MDGGRGSDEPGLSLDGPPRRAHELESVVDYLGSLGVASEMSDAARQVLERLGGKQA